MNIGKVLTIDLNEKNGNDFSIDAQYDGYGLILSLDDDIEQVRELFQDSEISEDYSMFVYIKNDDLKAILNTLIKSGWKLRPRIHFPLTINFRPLIEWWDK